MNNYQEEKDIIDLRDVAKTIWQKRKVFFIVWPVVFALSCLLIFPEPRYYTSEVKLAPEMEQEGVGGLASIASSFGFNLDGMTSTDAIYPLLYPELFESPEFIVSLFDITVSTDDGELTTDYYTYMKKHQKKNWLTQPFKKVKSELTKLISPDPVEKPKGKNEKVNPFNMSKKDNDLVEKVMDNVKCDIDKRTNVISISVKDQDRLVCALLADSIQARLQSYIITYRTKKAREDVKYYEHLADSAKREYDRTMMQYASYSDAHRNANLQTYIETGDKLRNEMSLRLGTYNTLNAQLTAAKAKIQERTPSFTTLVSPTVPQKPAGPKRVLFVLGMLILSTFGTALWLTKSFYTRK